MLCTLPTCYYQLVWWFSELFLFGESLWSDFSCSTPSIWLGSRNFRRGYTEVWLLFQSNICLRLMVGRAAWVPNAAANALKRKRKNSPFQNIKNCEKPFSIEKVTSKNVFDFVTKFATLLDARIHPSIHHAPMKVCIHLPVYSSVPKG